MNRIKLILSFALLMLMSMVAWSAPEVAQAVNITFDDAQSFETFAPALKIFLLLSALSFLPAAVIAVTAFTRIIVVLSMLRFAFGMQQTPPNSILITLALFLTLFTMFPVIEQVNQTAIQPYLTEKINTVEAIEQALIPVRKFMISQTRESDLAVILKIANTTPPASADDIKTIHLVPAFMLSELKTAFQIGFVIFLPFLLIDLVVASILMSLGMIMLPPTTISLPIKVLMFLLIDGWALVTQSLLASFSG